MDRAYPFTKSTSNGDKRKPGRFYCHCGVDVPETGMKEHLAGHTAPAYAPHVQDASLVVENAPQEEPLDPCSECGQLLPASEMIGYNRTKVQKVPQDSKPTEMGFLAFMRPGRESQILGCLLPSFHNTLYRKLEIPYSLGFTPR